MHRDRVAWGVMMAVAMVGALGAQTPAPAATWVASWAASVQGPYPSGNPSAQPDLGLVFPSAATGALDQSFRLIVKPDLWGASMRFRFANTFGAQPLVLDDVFVGLQSSAGNIAPGTNRPVSFAQGQHEVTIAAGRSQWSDPVHLPFVRTAADPLLFGRRLVVSFHAVGPTGPMTWHAKALTTSYLTAARSGSHGGEEDDAAFPFTTTSWYFLDAVDVMAPAETVVVACFGDSITDGTASTLNGDDRWPDVLSRRLHARYGTRVSVVNAGIGGNQIVQPAVYSATAPVAGGPSAQERLDRDVLGLSGLSAVVWLEGINDFGAGTSADVVIAGMREVAARLRANGVKVVAATVTSSLGSTTATHATAEVDRRRQTVNTFIRTGGAFDGVADFDLATRDPDTGSLRAAFQPNSTTGGAGDRLHPNRAGYQAMGTAIDVEAMGRLLDLPAKSAPNQPAR